MQRLLQFASSALEAVTDALGPTRSQANPRRKALLKFKRNWDAVTKFYDGLISPSFRSRNNSVDPLDNACLETGQVEDHLMGLITILQQEEQRNNSISDSAGMVDSCLEYFLEDRVLDKLCALGSVNRPPGTMKLVLSFLVRLFESVHQPLLPQMSVHQPVFQLIRVCAEMVGSVTQEPTSSPALRMGDPACSIFVQLLCVLCKKLVENPDLLDFFQGDTSGGESREFLLFTALLPFIRDSNDSDGDLARNTLLQLVQIPRVCALFVHSPLCRELVHSLCSQFRSLPVCVGPQLPKAESVRAFLNRVRFFNSFSRLARDCLAEQMVNLLVIDFFEGVVKPAVVQTNEQSVVSATLYLRSIVECCTAPLLLHECSVFLLGRASSCGPNSHADPNAAADSVAIHSHPLRATLIARINSLNEELSVATLHVFDALLSHQQEHAFRNLVLCRLASLSLPSPQDMFLDPIVFRTHFPSVAADSAGFDSYIYDAEGQTAMFFHSYKTCWTQRDTAAASGSVCEPSAPLEGHFLRALLDRLGGFLDLSISSNLVLTGIFARLAQCPHPLLHAYLLDVRLAVPAEMRSLAEVLQQLYQRVIQRAEDIPEFEWCFARTQLAMGVRRVAIACCASQELCAILQAKKNLLATVSGFK
eukprot:gnl/Spiro4/13850_TR7395_c0_g2_i1.p1 gnl/Spiro4/13850_TR7395_c0_g2~~gnl/Spiro4/13850_TR7395_c0_g2_i1.p1  ORF type:complete len:646 (+),score=189.21 gnl/Spiro4/13850_TR7395_c0_g2_i1:52-1989(+)